VPYDAYELDLTKNITSFVEAVRKGVHSDIGKRAIGGPVMEAVKQHFYKLNSERHHSWSGKGGFYHSAAQNTHMDVTDDGVEIVTDKTGLGLRIHGGTVLPGKNASCVTGRPTKYLTIPAIAEAYGHGACDFSNLVFVRFGRSPDSPAALVEKTPHGGTWAATGKKVRNRMKQGNQQGSFGRRVWFWCVLSATHQPDDSVVPDMDALEDVAEKAFYDYADKFNW
jgi:hypothetical protein